MAKVIIGIVLIGLSIFLAWNEFHQFREVKNAASYLFLPRADHQMELLPICRDFFGELKRIHGRFSVKEILIQNHNQRLHGAPIFHELSKCFSPQPLGKYVLHVDVFNSDYQSEKANDIFFQVSVIDFVTQNKVHEFSLSYPLNAN